MQKVLLVEDDIMLSDLYREMLLTHEYDVVQVQDGSSAIQAVKEIHPDLILSDVMMPHMDGLTLLRTLKADPSTADIPFILFTNLNEPHDREKALHEGAALYLFKSEYEPREIISLIAKVLEEKGGDKKPSKK